MLDSFLKDMLSPLGATYCDYFYYLMVIEIILIAYFLLLAAKMFFTSSNKKEDVYVHSLMYSLPTIFLSYFTHRLLYSMCAASLNK